MRVTNKAMTNTYLKDVQSNLQSMNKLNKQLNSGKEINRVSDNPYEAIKILNLQNEINDIDRYNYNCDEIVGWLDTTDGALDSIGSIVSEIKTLLTSISGAYGEDEISAIRSEVNEKMKQIGEALNSSYAGRYIFGGSTTGEPPVEIFEHTDGTIELKVKDTTNEDKLKAEISAGIGLDYNLTIGQVTDESKGLDVLNTIAQELGKAPADTEKLQQLNEDIGEYLTHILDSRSAIGARTNTVTNVKSNNEENVLILKSTYSGIQDVDWAEKYVELTSAQMVYNSCMQVGAKLMQPTLLDYLR